MPVVVAVDVAAGAVVAAEAEAVVEAGSPAELRYPLHFASPKQL